MEWEPAQCIQMGHICDCSFGSVVVACNPSGTEMMGGEADKWADNRVLNRDVD